eukprot:2946143-Lingulodinium_polyedra.AAC.1
MAQPGVVADPVWCLQFLFAFVPVCVRCSLWSIWFATGSQAARFSRCVFCSQPVRSRFATVSHPLFATGS